jgi:hypothetical protein
MGNLPRFECALEILDKRFRYHSKKVGRRSTDLIEANGLDDRCDEHDEGDGKTFEIAWFMIWNESSTLVNRNVGQEEPE